MWCTMDCEHCKCNNCEKDCSTCQNECFEEIWINDVEEDASEQEY